MHASMSTFHREYSPDSRHHSFDCMGDLFKVEYFYTYVNIEYLNKNKFPNQIKMQNVLEGTYPETFCVFQIPSQFYV